MSRLCFGILLFLALAGQLSAQWLHTPIPKIPQTADGKPDLSAPAPKLADGHPDLSGIWMPNTRTLQDLAVDMNPADVPYQPWAEKELIAPFTYSSVTRNLAWFLAWN